MSSNLKVNTILPSTGTTIGIGTVGGLINVVGNIDVNSTSGISTFNGLEISGIVTAKAGAAVTYYGDGSNLTGITDNVVTINNYASTRIVTATNNANELDAETNLTVNGSLVTFADSTLVVNKGTNPTISAKETAGNKEVQLRANTTGGLLRTVGSYPLVLGTNQTERLRITSDGKIGIGENNPIREFVLKNAGGNCQLSITSGTSNSAYLNLGDTDDDNIGSIYYDNGNNRIVFRANTTDIVRMESDGNIRILDGNLRIATAGHGIDFSATGNAGNSASMSNEILDDYEEGSWTPYFGVAGGASGQAFSTQEGTYTKIGNRVFCTFHIQLSNKGTQGGAGWVTLTNLPFSISGIGGGGSANYWDSFTSSFSPTVWRCMQGGTSVYIAKANGNTSTDLNMAQLTNSSRIYGSLYYHTNDM